MAAHDLLGVKLGDDRAHELNALREAVLPMMATPLAVVAWLWTMWVLLLMVDRVTLLPAIGPIALLSASVASLSMNRRDSSRASSLFLIGVFASCAALLWDRFDGIVPYLFGLCVAAAGVLLRPGTGLLMAGLSTIVLCLVARFGPNAQDQGSDLTRPLVLLWATTWIAVLATRNLYRAITWATESADLARVRTDEWLDQRQKLKQTLRSLDLMCALLARSRNEERAAREEADLARLQKAQFAANVSHELRTPLNLVIGFSELMYAAPELYGDLKWPQALRNDIGEIYRNSIHLQKLIDDILDLSQLEAMRMPLFEEATPIAELLRETVGMASGLVRGKDVDLVTAISDELPTLIIDRTRIRQVLLNLLGNAARFTERGTIELGAAAQDGGAHIWVADSGIGMSGEQLSRAFRDFEQGDSSLRRRYGGTGLGLALSKRFVEMHGGTIRAESEVGVGTTIHVALPEPGAVRAIAREPSRTPASEHLRGNPRAVRPTILLISPDAADERLLSRNMGGYQCLRATSLRDAARMICDEHPHAVIARHDAEPGALAALVGALGNEAAAVPVIGLMMPGGGAPRVPDNVRRLLHPVRRIDLLRCLDEVAPTRSRYVVVGEDAATIQMLSSMIRSERPDREVSAIYGTEWLLDPTGLRSDQAVVVDLHHSPLRELQVLEALTRSSRLGAVPVLLIAPAQLADEGVELPRVNDLAVHLEAGLTTDEWIACITGILSAVKARYVARPVPQQ